MNEFLALFLQQSVAMFAIIDPLGVSAILLSLAPATTTHEQMRAIAFKSTTTMIIAFFVVLLTGKFVLMLFGIELDSLRAMGGIVLLLMAIKMVQGNLEPKNQTPEERAEAKQNHEFAVIPLGIPITFGPGIFATIVIFKASASGYVDLVALTFAFLTVAMLTYLAFRYSLYIRHYLGITGQKIISRLMGLIVGAIAVQFIVGGVSSLWEKGV
jgi:multiple antibiotic resistance protein